MPKTELADVDFITSIGKLNPSIRIWASIAADLGIKNVTWVLLKQIYNASCRAWLQT